MDNQWTKEHELVQQPESKLKPGPGKNFNPTACFKLGSCVCKGDGKSKLAMAHKLTAHVKKSHPGTQKEPSPERQRFSEGLCVLEISPHDCDPDVLYDNRYHGPACGDGNVVLYLHVGATNFQTWEMTCTRLHCCHYNPFSGLLTLQAGDLGDAEVRTCLDFLKLYCDIHHPYFVRFLRVVSDRSLQLLEDFMLPKFVDVRLQEVRPQQEGSRLHCFWRGDSLEFAPKISKHRRRPARTQHSAEGGKQRSARPKSSTKKGNAAADDAGPEAPDSDHGGDEGGDDNDDNDRDSPEPDVDGDSGQFGENEVDDILRELCADFEGAPEPDADAEQEGEDQAHQAEEAFRSLLEEVIANCQVDMDAAESASDQDQEVDIDQIAIPQHHCDKAGPAQEAERDPDASSSTSSSSSSSTTSSSKGLRSRSSSTQPRRSRKRNLDAGNSDDEPGKQQRKHLTLAEAGAKSSSVFDQSTVHIGCFYIVKRFYPVLG